MIRTVYLLFLCGLFSLVLFGCNPDLSKSQRQTDAMVYEIIDGQWDPSLSAKANYRISDANSMYVSRFDLPEQTVLTIPQAVAIATGSSRQYETEKEALYLTALDYTEVRHLYEPMPILGGDGGYRKDGGKKAAGAFGNFGFQQLLATGAQVGGNISLGWMEIISGDYRSGFSSVVSAVISQPLLRGAGRKIALENLTQAERNTLYQIRTFNRYRKEFVTSIISDYYRVLQLNDTQVNARDNYYELFDTYKNLQKRAAAGKVQQHELEQANQDKLKALSDYTQARKAYRDAMDAFKIQLALPVDKDLRLDTGEFDVLKRSITSDIELTEVQAVEMALNQRLDLANAADHVADAERKVDVAADAIRAELNIIGYANPQTHQRTVFGASPGELESTRDRYQLSAQLDLPIDRLAEKNAYRRALIALMQSQRAHQELTDTVTMEVRKAYRKLQEAYRRYQVESEALQLAEKRTQNTILLLKYQRANTRDVLDARGDLLDAQDAATSALVDYATASLEFFRDTGTMKIKPDGMWQRSIPAEFQAKADLE